MPFWKNARLHSAVGKREDVMSSYCLITSVLALTLKSPQGGRS